MGKKSIFRSLVVLAAGASIALASPGIASAETQIGWTGGTLPIDGQIYLHNSSITTDSGLIARSKIWTATGWEADPYMMGVRTRLFKSGILCQVVEYTYNPNYAATLEVSTSGADCGSGSYNSHGFVKVLSATQGFKEYVTFPSNPVNYTVPGARSAPTAVVEPFVSDGHTFGLADQTKDSADQPDFIAAFTDDKQQGFVKNSDLNSDLSVLPVYSEDGTTEIGTLTGG